MLGRRRKWRHILPADHIRALSNQFLENFTIFKAYPEDGKDRYNRPFEGVTDSRGLLPGFRKMLEQNELWQAGQAELEAIADHQGGKPRKKTRDKPVPTEVQRLDDVPKKRPRKLRGFLINGPCLRQLFAGTGFSKPRFARELGLSLSTYKKAEKGGRLDENTVRLMVDNLNPVLRKDKDNRLTDKDLILPD